MRVVLRNTKIGLYYAGPDRWVSAPEQAQDFEDIAHAAKVARQAKRGKLQVFPHYVEGTSAYREAGHRIGDRRN